MPDSVPELVGPSLEKICEAASGRKFTKLRHEAKVARDEAFRQSRCFILKYVTTMLYVPQPPLPVTQSRDRLSLCLVQQMLTNMEELFKPPSEASRLPDKRQVVLHMNNVEVAAKTEKERLAALDATVPEASTAEPGYASAAAADSTAGEHVKVAFGPDGSLKLSITSSDQATPAAGWNQHPKSINTSCPARKKTCQQYRTSTY